MRGAVRTVLIAGWGRRPPKELVTKALEAAVAADTAAAPCPTGITGQGSRRGPPCSAKSSPRPQVRRKPGNPRSQAGLSSDVRVATWQSDPRTQSAGCGMPNKASQSSTALRKKSISLVHTPFRRPAPPSSFQSRRMIFRMCQTANGEALSEESTYIEVQTLLSSPAERPAGAKGRGPRRKGRR